ncbi:MAG: M14 family zinc carboxypeptidase [Methanobacteriota archaeon]
MVKKKNNKELVVILLMLMITGFMGSSMSTQTFVDAKDSMVQKYVLLRDNPGEINERDVFHTYDQMVADLQQIASTYPLITRLYDLGRSVQGRTIYGLKITDNPTVEENEPEFRIIGAHHGNEKMAAEVPLEMCWYLTQNYGSVPLVTHLVDEREIWIIPIMNVDGHVANSRYNSNGVDLNRDYGYVWGPGWTSPSPYSQPETRAIRNHAFNSTFGLSLSFHCSGDICNYVWNYKPEHTVDDALVYDFSVDYAAHNGYWVVEGYDWYQTRGDTNDFSYGCRGDIDWTIEIQSSNFAQAWSLNRDAILEMMNNQDIGLKGIVTDVTTGLPLKATVWTEPNFWPCFTDPLVGDYHRLLVPGDYSVHFQANGYQEQIHNIHIADSTPVVLNVALSPGGDRYGYQVVWAYIYDPYPSAGGNNFINNPTEVIAALGINDGQFASLGKGGSVCIDMAESGEILNGPGYDFTVYEAVTPEGYTVYVSQTGEYSGTWVSLGSATGTTSFDLGAGGVSRARYVKITDDNVGDAYETNPGFDFDAIKVLHAVQETPVVLNGDCFYYDMSPVNNVTVEVVNLNTSHRWNASTISNHYTLQLVVGTDVNAGHTLRIIARDMDESVNITDHIVTTAEISAGTIDINPILDVHYRDLKTFPFYTATMDTGAAIAQMMLNYLWWNSTLNPSGPPLYYPSQSILFTEFNTQGGLWLNGEEMASGLNSHAPSPIEQYGYFFSPSNSTNVNEVMQSICIWVDYSMSFYNQYHELPWPKPGYPMHVPVAIPTGGNYNSWMTVRGIHTDKEAWMSYPDFPAITVYGFWLNDPKTGGIGGNTYVTTQTFLTNYFKTLNVRDDRYDGQYLAIIEPPQGIPQPEYSPIVIEETPVRCTPADENIIRLALQNKASPLVKELSNNALIKTAQKAVDWVLRYDESLNILFTETVVHKKPMIKDLTAIVSFVHNNGTTFEVHLHLPTGELKEIRLGNQNTIIEPLHPMS